MYTLTFYPFIELSSSNNFKILIARLRLTMLLPDHS